MQLRPVTAAALLCVSFATAQSQQPQHALDVPYVPTDNAVVQGMLKLAGLKGTDTLYDLGCGDGRIVVIAARDYKAHGSALISTRSAFRRRRPTPKKTASLI